MTDMTTQTPDAVREAYMQGQVDMRERAAQLCDQRGAEEQEGFGLVRGTQNYFRARNAIRDLEIAALDSRAGDAGEGLERLRPMLDNAAWCKRPSAPDVPENWRLSIDDNRELADALLNLLPALLATPAPTVDAVPAGEDGFRVAVEIVNAAADRLAKQFPMGSGAESALRAASLDISSASLSHGEGWK